ncbi:MAG TPA: zinc ribbon domain-containing protein [Pyrinomonadaceae bacterium]|jgi:hypothetical protein|nr:zinc ribbon domain-containing protein [Pyrinomonadaceae bacterium]
MSSEEVDLDQSTNAEHAEEGTRVSRRLCPACGAEARRQEARFCSTCGRALEDSYLPADALRASYHLQHRPVARRKSQGGRQGPKIQMTSTFSAPQSNGAATTALAFMTYSLVPYLGILFSPGAVLLGAVGLIYSLRAPHRGGRRAAYASISFGLLILGVQILLWWIIIKVPEWTRPF